MNTVANIETIKTYYRNGCVKQEYIMVNGIKHGYYKEYYENGQIAYESYYLNGNQIGFSGSWTENGILCQIIHSDHNSIPHSESITFSEKDGSIQLYEKYNTYPNGGSLIKYYKNDCITRIERYENSVLHSTSFNLQPQPQPQLQSQPQSLP